MKKLTLLLLTLVAVSLPQFAQAQAQEYDLKKVDVEFVLTPEYTVNPRARQVRSQKWMQVEATFDAKPDFTEDLIFNYYIYFNKRLFVGRVHHVTIQKGRDLHSVAYISPNSIANILGGKQLTPSALENVTVTITKPGISAPLARKDWKPSVGEWWATMKAEEGFVVDKRETPFAPLSWDYYEALKPVTPR